MARITSTKAAEAVQAYLKSLDHDVSIAQCKELLAKAETAASLHHEPFTIEDNMTADERTGMPIFGYRYRLASTNALSDEIYDTMDECQAAARTAIAKKFIIPAKLNSDDYRKQVEFDAVLWFARATDEDISKIVYENFTAGYATDAIAEYLSDINKDVESVFAYINAVNASDVSKTRDETIGFSVVVDREKAIDWIWKLRPRLYHDLVYKEAIEPIHQVASAGGSNRPGM